MGSPEQLRLPMALGTSQQFQPHGYLTEGASRYAKAQGRSYDTTGLDQIQMDSRRGLALAKTFERNETKAPTGRTKASYEAMRRDTSDQYDFLTGHAPAGLAVNVEVTPEDPYRSPTELHRDLAERKISVLSTEATGGHAFFSNEENDKFRAVHDTFGHASTGRGFSRHGEEAAYRSHAQMYSPEATEAVTSETRGQNSYFNNLNKGFPENRVVAMPGWAADTGEFRGAGAGTKKIQRSGATQLPLF